MHSRIVHLAAAVTLSACTSMAQPRTPAVLVDPTAESHAELVGVASEALSVATVTIADDALTRESILIIERKPARDASGQRLSGRDLEKPHRFQLVASGAQCTLVHQATGRSYKLMKVRCKAL